ncbi:hypothetical protein H920_13501 [Fukomys damarensis]|uniref:Uncharacterized protein n=1 Tax=Fukomys damarensis TaxID=885580 RepID=A0A091D3N0_FUKDA|nr:hypothetical protein H920_13501 [Fukomys damarensis]
MLVCIKGSALGRPKDQWQKPENLCNEMKDFRPQNEPESDAHSEDESSPDETAAAPSDSEALSSKDNDENSLVRIRKAIRSKLLLENQQAQIFPRGSPFMTIGNNLQVDPRCPPHSDSVQLVVIN